jgi:hypothetical protein
MTASRHLLNLNKDEVSVNQFYFIQDADPALFSEKNNNNTNIWIRLRPFAFSLVPDSLVIRIKEVNNTLNIQGSYVDITEYCTITTYDAGAGLFGVDVLYTSIKNFYNESLIYVDITIEDSAYTPNILNLNYWFKIINDYKSPVVYNISPPKNANNVPRDVVIEFYITDYGLGLDIDDVILYINNSLATYNYSYLGNNVYKISYFTNNKYDYGSTLSIGVEAKDRSKYENFVFAFWTITFENSTGPFVDVSNSLPSNCSKGIDRTVPIVALQVYSIDEAGIDIESITLNIDNINYTDNKYLLPIISFLKP